MEEFINNIWMQEFDWISLLQIIAIDIVLSGDNALIIAMATKDLPKNHQNKAILFGVFGAIVLRIIFATGIVYLLKFPFIYLIGGIVLVMIGYKLVKKEEEETHHVTSQKTVLKAVITILLADIVMSLDNVMAVAGAAKGNLFLLVIGVTISIPIMIFGAKIIVHLFDRYSFLIYIGSAILVYTGVDMVMQEPFINELFQLQTGLITILLSLIITAGFGLSGYISNRKLEKT